MKNLLSISFTILTLFLLLFIGGGGCASQPKKTKVPAPLESEIKSIEGQKPSVGYQPVSPGERTIYIVKKGDTLWRISKAFGVSAETIIRANHITNTKDLEVGQKLIIPVSGKSYTPTASHSGSKPTSNVAGGVSSRGFIWPVKGQITSRFGEIRNGVKNAGVSIMPQPGQKIVAAKKGVVEAVSDSGNGIYVTVIKHEGGVRTIYECRCNPAVGEGSYVEQGQPIANIGLPGDGKSQEINFKIYVKDKPVNPLSYLP